MKRTSNTFRNNFPFPEFQKTSEDLWLLTFLGGIEIKHRAKLSERVEAFVIKKERNRASTEGFFPMSSMSTRFFQVFVNHKGSFI